MLRLRLAVAVAVAVAVFRLNRKPGSDLREYKSSVMRFVTKSSKSDISSQGASLPPKVFMSSIFLANLMQSCGS